MARSPRVQRPRHTWTNNDRVILALLYRLYGNGKSDILPIWSLINRDVLLAEGFWDGSMHITALMTQRYDLKRTQHPAWTQVWNTPLQVLRRKYRIQKDRIENAAQALGIKLELRVEPRQSQQPVVTISDDDEPSVTATFNSTTETGPVRRDAWSTSTEPDNELQRARRATESRAPVLSRQTIRSFMFDRSANGAMLEAETQEASGDMMPPVRQPAQSRSIFEAVVIPTLPGSSQQNDLPQTPKLTDPLKNVRASPKLMSVFNSEGGHAKRHPVVLFRAYDPQLGFTSRRFQNAEAVDVPPPVDSEAFKAQVTPHLFVSKDFDSPFVSLTQFARYALRIISASDTPRNFAVFLYSDLDEEGSKRNKMRPRLVPKICDQHDLNERLRNCYRGRGEFLMWGCINSKPLLILETGAALELFGALKNIEECNPDAAAKLYPFLEAVDVEYREVVLRALVTSMKIPGHDWWYHSPRWEAFADLLFPETSLEEHSRRSESILSAISVHHTPSSSGEGYLLIEDADAEDDNIDIRATEEYAEIFTRPQDNFEDPFLTNGSSVRVDEPQRSVDAQLLSDMRAYIENEHVVTALDAQRKESNPAAMLEEFMRNTASMNPISNTRTPSDSSTSTNEVVDLTGDTEPAAKPASQEPNNDIMIYDRLDGDDADEEDNNDNGFVILTLPMPRQLSIRSRSAPVVQDTPSRSSRWPEFHVHVLDD